MAENINSSNQNELIKLWHGLDKKPKCIVFDLDYTIWPFMIDSNILPPFRYNSTRTTILDHQNKKIQLYEDVKEIIIQLSQFRLVHLAIASRSTAKDQAIQLLNMFELTDYFHSIQIYSGSKLKHMQNIRADLIQLNSQINFEEFLFFDDNKSNLDITGNKLGVIGHKVGRHFGLNYSQLFEGLKKFNNKI